MIVGIYQTALPEVGKEVSLRMTMHPPRATIPRHIIANVGPAPLVDEIPRTGKGTGKKGRPSLRPEGVPPLVWGMWLRNTSTRGYEDTPQAFAIWVYERGLRIKERSLRLGWGARIEPSERLSSVHWVTVVHRRDLTPELEQQWRARIAKARPGSTLYRIHLRGIQRREVR